jgi:hypothetical protein
MTTAHHEATIDRPAEEVFDFLADGADNASWQPRVVATIGPDGPIGVGTTFRQTVRSPLGFKVSADYELTEFDRPGTLALKIRSVGPIRPTQRFELSETADGQTTIRNTIDYRATGIMRLASPVFALLRPLFRWEGSWIKNVRGALTR